MTIIARNRGSSLPLISPRPRSPAVQWPRTSSAAEPRNVCHSRAARWSSTYRFVRRKRYIERYAMIYILSPSHRYRLPLCNQDTVGSVSSELVRSPVNELIQARAGTYRWRTTRSYVFCKTLAELTLVTKKGQRQASRTRPRNYLVQRHARARAMSISRDTGRKFSSLRSCANARTHACHTSVNNVRKAGQKGYVGGEKSQ